jgi:hypothetical protein
MEAPQREHQRSNSERVDIHPMRLGSLVESQALQFLLDAPQLLADFPIKRRHVQVVNPVRKEKKREA